MGVAILLLELRYCNQNLDQNAAGVLQKTITLTVHGILLGILDFGKNQS